MKKNTLIFEEFLERLKEDPDRIAVLDDKRSLTYRELFEKSCQLASTLNDIEIKSPYILIIGNKSLESIIAILGTLFSSYTYVTLDINYPTSRLDHIFSLLTPSVLILTGLNARLEREIKKMKEFSKYIIDLSGCLSGETLKNTEHVKLKNEFIEPIIYPDSHIAYTLFTSGSTGQPKGVCMSHRAASSALRMFQKHIGLTNQDLIINQVALCFDISVFDIFGSLNVGGTLCIVPPEITALPDRFFKIIEEYKATSLYTTPSTLDFLLKNKIASQSNIYLRKIISSGEPIPHDLLKNIYGFFSENIEFWNIYGGTEIPYVLSHRIEKNESDKINVFSLKDEEIEIKVRDVLFDEGKNTSIGELLVKGAAVLSGYIHNHNQGISSPLIENDWYPTGDLVSIDDKNWITLHGRRDRQVKIKGYRIELDEVELQLAKCPEVQEIAVILSKERQEILAYLVLNPSSKSKEESLEIIENFCGAKLPGIFRPSNFNIIEKMPHTTSGKKDRKTLIDM